MGYSNIGSCVVVGSVRERGVDVASGLLRIVLLVLYFDFIVNVNVLLGMLYLMLMFVWLGLCVVGGVLV